MSETASGLPTKARAVIIGGGVIGCSVAYHLAKLGWKDVVLLERKQLTCGTTWHAAGLIGQLRATANMTQLAKYSAELYATLEAETGVATGFKQNGSVSVALTAGSMIAFTANAAPISGETAPGFTDMVTASGETISLSDFANQTVVLEWTNHDCPFVKKHYAEPVKNMQSLQTGATEGDIVWIQVISSAPGKQGYLEADGAMAKNSERASAPTYTVLDPSGDMGRA